MLDYRGKGEMAALMLYAVPSHDIIDLSEES